MPPIETLSRAMQEFPPSMETLRTITFPSIEMILDALPRVELLSPPGTQVSYSNLGIALLAHAMERISGQSYESNIEKYILAPLGMKQSGFHPLLVIRQRELSVTFHFHPHPKLPHLKPS